MNDVKIGPCIGKILVKYAADIGVILFAQYGEIKAKVKVDGIEKNGDVRYTMIDSFSEGIDMLPNPIDPIYLYPILN